MKLNIAICYKGLLRTIDYTFDNHKKFLFGNNNIDVFCHTWDTNNDVTYNFVKNLPECKFIFKEQFKNFNNHPYDSIFFDGKINSNLHSTNLKFIESHNIVLHSKPFNILSHLYSTHQSYMLCNLYSQINNKEYDLVCMLRPDIFFYNSINFYELIYEKINISWFEKKGDLLNYKNAIIDHIAISKPEVIKTYCETFLNISGLYFKQKEPLIPEVLFGSHLNQNNIEINMLSTTHTVFKPEGTI
jgi:hypothetical protein